VSPERRHSRVGRVRRARAQTFETTREAVPERAAKKVLQGQRRSLIRPLPPGAAGNEEPRRSSRSGTQPEDPLLGSKETALVAVLLEAVLSDSQGNRSNARCLLTPKGSALSKRRRVRVPRQCRRPSSASSKRLSSSAVAANAVEPLPHVSVGCSEASACRPLSGGRRVASPGTALAPVSQSRQLRRPARNALGSLCTRRRSERSVRRPSAKSADARNIRQRNQIVDMKRARH
jgi:hypothetical protein